MRLAIKQKFIGILLLTTVLLGNISTFAQTNRGANVASKTSNGSDPKTCNSGYNGSVKYTKVVQTSSSGRYGTNHNMKRTYQLNVAVRDDGRQQGSVSMSENGLSGSFNLYGQGTATTSETDDRLDVSEKDDYCKLSIAGMNGKTRVRCESRYNRQTNAAGERADTNIYIGIRGDRMHLGISSLPKLNGDTKVTSKSSCTGMCGKDQPIDYTDSGVVKDAGERSVATDDNADIKINPKSFNRLSGTWTNTEQTPGGTVTETFQWNLSRCAPPLEIDNLRFEQKRVKSPNDWIGVDPMLTGTYDGNIVKIKATVFNNGGDTAYANVKFTETRSGTALPNGTVSVAVNPGEARHVEYEWDTTGYAWDDNVGRVLEREIKAEIQGDSKNAKIKILPKPVVLAHGLWSNAAAWAEWHNYLREAHSNGWEAFPVGEDAEHGKMNTGDHAFNYDPTNSIFQNAQELGKQIKYVREQKNAWHVDLVVHSMGGLISRFYIHNFMQPVYDGKPEATHLVMLGTPNQGSACADLMYGFYNSRVFEKPVEALRQLKPSVVEEYNKKTYNRKGVKFSILAGFGAGPTCGLEIGDGVVPMSSALYNIVDHDYAGTHHLALTDKKYFESFVLPHIAIGPKKARSEQATAELDTPFTNENLANNEEQTNDRYGFAKFFRKASYKSADVETNEDPKNLTMREGVELEPKQTKEINITVRDGSGAGVVLLAMPYISATLADANGAVVGNSPINSGGLLNYFRTIAVQKEIKNGVWKLKLENQANVKTTVLVAGFTNGGAATSFTVEAGKPVAGNIPLVARLTENNSPVLNAKITGNIVGQSTVIEFFDDGKHNDGVASDGVYGASVAKLGKGEYFVEVKAEVNNQTKMAIAQVNGGAQTPAKNGTPSNKPATPRRGRVK